MLAKDGDGFYDVPEDPEFSVPLIVYGLRNSKQFAADDLHSTCYSAADLIEYLVSLLQSMDSANAEGVRNGFGLAWSDAAVRVHNALQKLK